MVDCILWWIMTVTITCSLFNATVCDMDDHVLHSSNIKLHHEAADCKKSLLLICYIRLDYNIIIIPLCYKVIVMANFNDDDEYWTAKKIYYSLFHHFQWQLVILPTLPLRDAMLCTNHWNRSRSLRHLQSHHTASLKYLMQ